MVCSDGVEVGVDASSFVPPGGHGCSVRRSGCRAQSAQGRRISAALNICDDDVTDDKRPMQALWVVSGPVLPGGKRFSIWNGFANAV